MVSNVDMNMSFLSMNTMYALHTTIAQEIRWRHEATIAEWYKSLSEKESLQQECFGLKMKNEKNT